MRREAGMTLLELLITLAVAALLLGVAAPNFAAFIQANREAAAVNELVRALNYARSAAISRNVSVTLCRSPDGRQCDQQLDWNAGWLVFENRSGHSPPRVAAGDTPLWFHGALPASARVLSNRGSFTFHPLGSRSINGTLLYCSEDGRHDRAVIISVTGRVRVADAPNSETNLSCS